VQNDNDSSFIELNEDGVPIQRWYYSDDTDSWIPIDPSHTLVKTNDVYVQLDEAGVPLGTWKYDDESSEWLFYDDEVPLSWYETNPLSRLPQTGVTQWPISELLIAGVLLILLGLLLIRRIKKNET